MLILLSCALLGLCKELFGSLGERAGERVVTNLAHDEVAVARCRSLAVKRERVLALVGKTRVKAEAVPVASSVMEMPMPPLMPWLMHGA